VATGHGLQALHRRAGLVYGIPEFASQQIVDQEVERAQA
jgi:hypothetical protein